MKMTDEQRAEKLKVMKERTEKMTEGVQAMMEDPTITAKQKAILLTALTDIRYGDSLMERMINREISPDDKEIEEFMGMIFPKAIMRVGIICKEIEDAKGVGLDD